MNYPAYILVVYTIVIIVLSLGVLIRKGEKSRTTKAFLFLIGGSFLSVVTTLLAFLFEGRSELKVFIYIFNLLTFFAIDLNSIAFINYVNAIIKTKKGKMPIISWICIGLCLSRILIVIILFATKNLFLIDGQGEYIEQNLIFIPYIISALAMFLALILIIMNKKHFSTRAFVIILIYQALPIPAMAMELWLNEFTFLPAAITIALLLIYIMLQHNTMEKAEMRNAMLEEISYTDILTGMNNRRSFYDTLEKLNEDEIVGVIFCDINGLKYTNDHFGHEAGDSLIKRYANLLLSIFGEEETYRISGDEFVVLLKHVKKEEFLKLYNQLKEAAYQNNHIGACGHSYGAGSQIKTLIAEAEAMMYVEKANDKLAIKRD